MRIDPEDPVRQRTGGRRVRLGIQRTPLHTSQDLLHAGQLQLFLRRLHAEVLRRAEVDAHGEGVRLRQDRLLPFMGQHRLTDELGIGGRPDDHKRRQPLIIRPVEKT